MTASMPEQSAALAPGAPAKLPWRRLFYWSVRRELWENRAIYLGPLAIEAVVLVGFFFASFSLPGSHQILAAAAAAGSGESRVGQSLNMPYAAAAGAAFTITFLVSIFYSLGALHGERRDRSILFWKSLPVSDLTTVLSKAAIPLLVQPLLIIAVAVPTQLIMLTWSTAILLLNGVSPTLLWSHLHLPLIWTMLPYGLAINALWDVPVYGWLLLVSAWAKRNTFIWAVAPPLALALFEYLAFHTRYVVNLLGYRLFGGFTLAYMTGGKGKVAVTRLSQTDPLGFLVNPGLWTGLLFGAACLAACVWLRRRRQPI